MVFSFFLNIFAIFACQGHLGDVSESRCHGVEKSSSDQTHQNSNPSNCFICEAELCFKGVGHIFPKEAFKAKLIRTVDSFFYDLVTGIKSFSSFKWPNFHLDNVIHLSFHDNWQAFYSVFLN